MNTSIKATKSNAISTLISGLLIVGFHNQLANIFAINQKLPFLIIGGIITFFSLTMFIEIKKQRALALLWIIVQDALFVIVSLGIAILQPFDISNTGYMLIAGFTIPIIYFIIIQSKGIIEMDNLNSKGVKQITYSHTIEAPKKVVWEVITDLENYHKVASNIDDVKIVSGEGKGLVRKCSHGKDSWTETCTLWEEESHYSFEVNTTAPNYPYPFKFLKGTWATNEISNSETEIVMHFEFEFKKPYQKLLLYPIMKWQFSKIGADLLKNWEIIILSK